MRRVIMGVAAAASAALASSAGAQQTYPTAAGGVRVQGTVPLQCNASGANCAPVTATNPQTTSSAGDVANGAADSGNPVKVGAVYNTSLPTYGAGQRTTAQALQTGAISVAPAFLTTPADGTGNTTLSALVADAGNGGNRGMSLGPTIMAGFVFNGTSWDRQRGDVNGLVVQPAMSSSFWSFASAAGGIVNTTTAVTIRAAAGAGVRNYLCTINIGHDTLGAASEFAVRDGAAGAVLFRMKLQSTANEGNSEINFWPCLKGTANTLLEVVTLTATVSGGVFFNASGYTGT